MATPKENISLGFSWVVGKLNALFALIPTKTSDLTNDGEDTFSPFVQEDGLKTVNGNSLIGSGNLAITTDATIPDYADITALLANQGIQVDGGIYGVEDASADPNITFASGETRLQAYYRYNGVATGQIEDYELISAPYGNHSVSRQITKTANYTLDPTENDATIISEGKICMIDPITKTYPAAFTVAMKNDGAATNLVIVPKTGWSYQLNDADAVSLTTGGSNVTLTWTKGATCTVILKGSTNKIMIDGGVE